MMALVKTYERRIYMLRRLVEDLRKEICSCYEIIGNLSGRCFEGCPKEEHAPASPRSQLDLSDLLSQEDSFRWN